MSATTLIARPTRQTIVRDDATFGLYALLGLFAFIESSVGPSMPFLREKLGMSFSMGGLHFSVFALGGVVTGLLGERIVFRIGRRAALWGGMAGMALCAAMLVLSPVVLGTLAAAFALGAIAGLALMTNQSSLSDKHGDGRTVAIAESNVAASCASILGPLAIGTFDRVGIGWQWGLLAASPAFLLLAWRFGKMTIPPAPKPAASEAPAGPLPRLFWIYAVVLFMVASIEWVMFSWGAEFLDTEVGMSAGSAATAMSAFFVAMAIGRFAGARLAQVKSGTTLLFWAIGGAAVGFPIFWLGGNPVVSVIGLFIAGIGIANFYPLSVAAAATAASTMADKATARLMLVGASAFLIVPLFVGAIADAVGMRWGFGIVVPLLAGALLALAYARRQAPGLRVAIGSD